MFLKQLSKLTRSKKNSSFSSQWQGVLDIIAKALFDNNMEFAQINGIHKFQVCTFTLDSW